MHDVFFARPPKPPQWRLFINLAEAQAARPMIHAKWCFHVAGESLLDQEIIYTSKRGRKRTENENYGQL